MSDENVSVEARGCGDGGCVFRPPSSRGMHTNGGCRCVPRRMLPLECVDLRKRIRSVVVALDAERAASGVAMERLGEVAMERDEARRERDRYHDAVIATDAERDKMMQERDRLSRILAVERGDEVQAPEGWRVGASGWFAYGEDPGQCDREVMREDLTEPWLWVVYSDEGPAVKQGTASSALEAMQAADAARTTPEPTP